MAPYPLTLEQMCLLKLATLTWKRRASAKRIGLSLGEETISEMMLIELKENFPGDVTILPFNKNQESKTGADWAWAFQSHDKKYTLPMLVQAKLLSNNNTYNELDRNVGKHGSSTRQIDLLIDQANVLNWPAIYAFYNHLDNKSTAPNNCMSLNLVSYSSIPEEWGISVADALTVRAALDAPAAPSKKSGKSFRTHSGHSIPLHCLLCSTGKGAVPPKGSPQLILEALNRISSESIPEHAAPRLELPLTELPHIFRWAQEINAIRSAIQRAQKMEELQKEFPTFAGIVILKDKSRPRRHTKKR
jgi:hypothetical protein